MNGFRDGRIDRGDDYVLSVCDAIGAATAEQRVRDPNVFRIGDVDLAYAIERELFMRMENRSDVHASFASGGSSAIGAGDALERRVMELVLNRSGSVTMEDGPSASRRAVRALGGRLRRVAPPVRVEPSNDDPVPRNAEACFVVHHEKFVRYVEPVIARIGADRCVAIARPDADLALEAIGVRSVAYVPQVGNLSLPVRSNYGLVREYSFFQETLERASPRVVLVLEGNARVDETANRVAHALGIPTICVQQGWSPLVHTGFRNMSFDSMAVWGSGFAELLAPFNPGQRFDVTGSIALDPSIRTPVTRSDGAPPTVLFALQTVAPRIPEQAVVSFLQLIDSVARRCPGARLLVREHPGHPIAAQGYGWKPSSRRIELVPPSRHRLGDVLAESDIVVSISSTTLLEGVALLRPAVVVNETLGSWHSPDLEAWGAGIVTTTMHDALAVIARLVDDGAFLRSFEPGMRAFRDAFFGGADISGIENLSRLVERVTREGLRKESRETTPTPRSA